VAKIRVGRGKNSVTIDGALAEDIVADLEDNLGPLIDVMQDTADGILERSKKVWPVKTGRSRDSFDTVITLTPGELNVEVTILSDVEYVRFIKSTKVRDKNNRTRDRSPFQEHIRKPARKSTRRLKKELVPVLADMIQEEIDNNG